MLTKIVCVLLAVAVTKAFPSSDVKPTNDEPTCLQKIAWYRDITNKTKMMYAEYREKVVEAQFTLDVLNKLDTEHSSFEKVIAPILEKYGSHPDNSSSTSNDARKETLCDNIDSYRMATINLTRSAITLKSNVLNLIDHPEIPKEAKDSLNKTLTKIVNFLIEIDMTENTFKDLEPLAKEAETQATQETELEKLYKISDNGVEFDEHLFDDTQEDRDFEKFLDSAQEDLKTATRALEERERLERERVVAKEDDDDYDDVNDGLPIHLHPGRTLVNAFKHPALPLTIIGVILIVICGMLIWAWVRPQRGAPSQYTQMP